MIELSMLTNQAEHICRSVQLMRVSCHCCTGAYAMHCVAEAVQPVLGPRCICSIFVRTVVTTVPAWPRTWLPVVWCACQMLAQTHDMAMLCA
jgi:hypothetical protein